MKAQNVPAELCTIQCRECLYSIEERKMANIVRKQAVSVEGPSVRERLQAMDDSAVVTAFLGGEERAFSELVTRYQTRLLNFVYRTIGDREKAEDLVPVSYTHLRAHETRHDLVCRLLLEKKKK